NIVTGAVIERTFNPTDKMAKAHIETKEMQYLYNDGDLYYFMDLDTYDQLPLTDRKSTRLNSSHVSISYAVFCLKKKKKKNQQLSDTGGRNKSKSYIRQRRG